MEYYTIKFRDGTYLAKKNIGIKSVSDIKDCRIFKGKGYASTIINEMKETAKWRVIREHAKYKSEEEYTDLEKMAFKRMEYWYPDNHYNQIETLLLVDPKHCKLKISEADDQE